MSRVIVRHCLEHLFIGQFTPLLPSLDVKAVSQAFSPESFPKTPLPVIASQGHYPWKES